MANTLFYPADVEQVPGAAWPVREGLALIGAMLAGAALVFAATHLRIGGRAACLTSPVRVSGLTWLLPRR